MKKLVLLFIVLFTFGSLCATTVYDIQYTTNDGDGTYPSPMNEEEVTVVGIVTANEFGGTKFFICDLPEVGVGPWHGIYIYEYEANPAVGDKVEVTGEVSEYYGLTEIGWATVTILSSGNPVPAPLVVSTNDLIEPDDAEKYESVLVELHNVEVVEGQDDYGQWYVDDDSGECQIDDGFFYLDTIDPPIVISPGDTWEVLIGIVDYGYDEYALNPRTVDDMQEIADADPNIISTSPRSLSNYPNPFNPETTIQFTTKLSTENTEISIYNIQGQKIRTLVDQKFSTGDHSVVWNGKDDNGKSVTSGMYFYKMRSGRYTSTKKMILMK